MDKKFIFASDKVTIEELKKKYIVVLENDTGCYFENDNSIEFSNLDDYPIVYTSSIDI